MSQIGYANPYASAPDLAPLGPTGDPVDGPRNVRARRARLAALVPLVLCLAAHWIFFLAYWIPETSTFPAHQWWLAQLSPLVSKVLTSNGQPQVVAQASESGVPGVLLLICAAALLWLSRTRHWWGRAAMAVPSSGGLLVTLVAFLVLTMAGRLGTSAVGLSLMLLWVVCAGYATASGYVADQSEPAPRTWRSGLGWLAAYALVGPAPVAVGRCLFGPTLRDAAAGLQGNTAALRLAALLTPTTFLLYLSGVLVGVTIWVAHLWWPPRRRLSWVGLSAALAASLLCTLWLGWPTNTAAAKRTTTLRFASPAAAKHYPCGSRLLAPDLEAGEPKPTRTLVVTGLRCRRVTVFSGYRQLSTTVSPSSVSPVEAKTPTGEPISGRLVMAEYGEMLVIATNDRFDSEADQLVGLRIRDGATLWTYRCPDRQALAVRFAAVPGGDQLELGHVTVRERAPQIVTRCGATSESFAPGTGPVR